MIVYMDELKRKEAHLKDSNDRSYGRVLEIAKLANECLCKTHHSNCYKSGQYGLDYRIYGETISRIRDICKRSIADVDPYYEMLVREMSRDWFDPEKLAKAIEAIASEKQIEYSMFYTPGWLCDLAKKLLENKTAEDAK